MNNEPDFELMTRQAGWLLANEPELAERCQRNELSIDEAIKLAEGGLEEFIHLLITQVYERLANEGAYSAHEWSNLSADLKRVLTALNKYVKG